MKYKFHHFLKRKVFLGYKRKESEEGKSKTLVEEIIHNFYFEVPPV